VNIKTTLEGENNWKIIYTGQEATSYQHFDAFVENDKLYVYLMENTGNNTVGVGDKRPLYFQEFTLTETTVQQEPTSVLVIEAEDFTTASNDIVVGSNNSASGGRYIDSFRSNQFLEYNFNITNAGDYDIVLYVAVRNRDDSVMDVKINEQLYENFLVVKTGDWNIYEENKIENVSLKQGENVIRLTQKRSLSSEPDKIEIFSKANLSTNSFNTNEITVYPNPSTGNFKLNTSIKNIKYQLINLQGRVLQKGIVKNNKLDFSSYAKGIYLLHLNSSINRTLIKKIFIK
ncbi:T9SS type A sorting domain-containing protein, partial [Polaribacter sp.]|uniref:T9SS type A sorting domain-containing protein n=1 Tax=Polaribacter sp. TaxID=1920175 RepID=UPI003F6958A4